AATDWSQGDELEVSFTVSGGTGPYAVQLLVGNGPGSLERVARTTLAAAGSGTLKATGLVPGVVYYWQVSVTDAGGSRAASDDSANVTMPAGAALLNNNTAISWSLDQRTATLKGILKTLGAGDTWALLYATDHLYDRWPNDIRAFRGSTTNTEEKVLLPETGAFSITQTYQWGEEIGFNWVISNSNGRTTWITTRQPDYDGNDAASRAHFWVGDYQTYTWKGGEGLWTNTDMWRGDGTMDGHDQALLPITGSYFTFPANEESVVTIPAGASLLKPVAFDVPAGASVTLKSDAGVADFGLWRTDAPARRTGIFVREGGSLVVSGLKGRWAPRDDNGSSMQIDGKNASIVIKDGSDIDLGWGYGQWGLVDWSNNRAGGGIRIEGGSKLYLRGVWGMSGPNEYVIDDSQVTMAPSGTTDDCRIDLALTGEGRLVFRGVHPLLQANNRFRANTGNNPNGAEKQYVDFEIPAGGFVEAPLRSRAGSTVKLGDGGGATRQMVFRVPATSPIAAAKGVVDQPLIYWPAGKEDWMILDNANLPNPDTDYWYETTDDLTGAFTGWGVHIVGRPASEAPQIVGFEQTNLLATTAMFVYNGIPGDNAASATFTATIARTDDPTDTTAALAGDVSRTVSEGTAFALTATGLVEGGTYEITVTGVDPDDETLVCTETITFDALRDYAAASTASAGATAEQDGPYTVWTFTDAGSEGEFVVTRGGTARILVVGGGGSGGGADTTDTNTSNGRRGGGG
ncbi:MAG: hypothetical protein IJ829_02555, partial [Kiritimatiellae bacterium]|nr:hypothetical protein [Kiritimatiellia bacterium]